MQVTASTSNRAAAVVLPAEVLACVSIARTPTRKNRNNTTNGQTMRVKSSALAGVRMSPNNWSRTASGTSINRDQCEINGVSPPMRGRDMSNQEAPANSRRTSVRRVASSVSPSDVSRSPKLWKRSRPPMNSTAAKHHSQREAKALRHASATGCGVAVPSIDMVYVPRADPARAARLRLGRQLPERR